ncbi:MAG: long-chain-fatty-acid--CoA ligase, partial [Hyphomicrobiales bacterium]
GDMKCNIGDLLRRRATVSPDLEAIVDLDAGKRFSYAELNGRVDAMCHALADAGVGNGDRVALLMYNCVEFVDCFYAAAKLGAVTVPLNWRLVADELAFILKDSGASLLVFGSDFAEAAADIHGRGAEATDVTRWIEVGDARQGQSWSVPYDDLLGAGKALESEIAAFDDDLAFIMYTSGTTGLPKGAMHSHATAFGALWNVLATIDLRERDRYLIVLPLYHVGALTPLMSNLYCGASVTLMRQFDPAGMWETIESERITTTIAVPAMLNFMLSVPGLEARDITALRAIMSGASPVPVALIEQYFRIGIEIHQVYGLTESGGPGCYLGGADAMAHAGSAGRGYLMTDVRVVDADGNDVAPGEPGEVLLRGDHNMLGYWNRPEATAETLRDGWLHTGDVAIRDQDGFVTIHDRIKDVVISGGENVYPAEVENVLLQHPDVADVAVIGQQSAAWGECTFAVVVRRNDAVQEADILAFCDGKMARFKVPKAAAFVDEIPRNPTGKPLKRVLREQFPGPAPE